MDAPTYNHSEEIDSTEKEIKQNISNEQQTY